MARDVWEDRRTSGAEECSTSGRIAERANDGPSRVSFAGILHHWQEQERNLRHALLASGPADKRGRRLAKSLQRFARLVQKQLSATAESVNFHLAQHSSPPLAVLSMTQPPAKRGSFFPEAPLQSLQSPLDSSWGLWEEGNDPFQAVELGTTVVPDRLEFDRPQIARLELERPQMARIGTRPGPKLVAVQRDDEDLLCYEVEGGVKRQYRGVKEGERRGRRQRGFLVIDEGDKQSPAQSLLKFVRSYVVPEGYPESVSPAYTPYMQWRAVQYFFGGAMSVFTTRSLLQSLGLSRGGAASTAVAVNWVIKDGAGRIGKMLFARHGRKFDCDLKQLRFAGNMLMELGAGVELATSLCPKFFLPLACAANVAKNVSAVTATSTRAPIYKAFARRENLGDVTAKGESISNLSDLLGTGMGILISKRNPSLVTMFAILSTGYLIGSYNEIKSVQLPTLNRARFSVAVRTFLESGRVPSPPEANRREAIIVMPWAAEKPMELGVRVSQAFADAKEFKTVDNLFKDEKYLVTYRKKQRRAYAVLKESAGPDDVLRAAFQAHMLLHILHGCPTRGEPQAGHVAMVCQGNEGNEKGNIRKVSDERVALALEQSCMQTQTLFDSFKKEAAAQGWVIKDALLNPGDARLCIGESERSL